MQSSLHRARLSSVHRSRAGMQTAHLATGARWAVRCRKRVTYWTRCVIGARALQFRNNPVLALQCVLKINYSTCLYRHKRLLSEREEPMPLKKLSTTAYPPRHWAIYGSPGAGKSTLAAQMNGPLAFLDEGATALCSTIQRGAGEECPTESKWPCMTA